MERKTITFGDRVVRSKGDYVVGRVGKVVGVDNVKGRRQVAWDGETTTWVAMGSIELESTPYTIDRFDDDKYRNPKTGRYPYPKYRTL